MNRTACAILAMTLACLPALSAVGPFGALPVSFFGDLPCADCDGIRYRLNLFESGSFFLHTRYLGKTDDAEFFDIGRWVLSSDGRTLILKGGREAPVMFRVVDADTLRMLDLEGRDVESTLDYTLAKTATFERVVPRLPMRGMFTYMADAGRFSECLTGESWPVAQVEDNAELERAYLEVREDAAEPVLVSLEGRVELRPAMEGDRKLPTLVVERVIGAWPGETCGSRFVSAALEGTYWKLTRLGDEPVLAGAKGREPHLVLSGDEHRAGGLGGCNRFTGSYSLAGKTIRFEGLASTRMACPEGMEAEQAFLEAMAQVRSWSIAGQHLELFDGSGQLVARFEARAMP